MRYLLILGLLLLGIAIFGCGPAPMTNPVLRALEPTPDRVSAHGVWIHAQGHADYLGSTAIEDQHSYLINAFHAQFGTPPDVTADCLSQASIWVWDIEEIRSWTHFGAPGALGYQDGNYLHVAAYESPLDSPIAHETAHLFQECLWGQYDYRHEAPHVWEIVAARPRPRHYTYR